MPNSRSKHLNNLLNSYTPLPIQFARGKGAWLFDQKEQRYLDLIAGMGVTLLGHAAPEIIKAIQQQSNKIIHLSNLVEITQQATLAKLINQQSRLAVNKLEQPVKMFFTNSGAEAIETAIKLTRLYANFKNINDPKIIVMHNAYHGRTMAALSASDNPEFKIGFEPLLDNFIRVNFNDINAIKDLAASHSNIVGILLEPIQGEGGVNLPDPNYLSQIRKLCTTNNWLMILDEIQTGLGRTGKMFCYQHYRIKPDVLIIAKGLANGIPIGACIIKQPFADLFQAKSHGSTFGGNPLACSVAIKTLEIIKSNQLAKQANALGKYFIKELQTKLINNPKVKEIRGKGLMIGIELDQPYPDLMLTGLKHNILFNVTRNKVIRILPPLIIKKSEIDLAVKKLVLVLNS